MIFIKKTHTRGSEAGRAHPNLRPQKQKQKQKTKTKTG